MDQATDRPGPIGQCRWAISEGYIPSESTEDLLLSTIAHGSG